MANTMPLVAALQNDLKEKFDANLSGLAKLSLPALLSIAKAQNLRVTERRYYNPPFEVRNSGVKFTAENKKLFMKWLNSLPKNVEFGFNWAFSSEVPLYTKASEVYTLIHHDITERLLRATSGRNKDFIGLMINFNFIVEKALKAEQE